MSKRIDGTQVISHNLNDSSVNTGNSNVSCVGYICRERRRFSRTNGPKPHHYYPDAKVDEEKFMMLDEGFDTIADIPIGAEAPRLILTLGRILKTLKSLSFTIYRPQSSLEKRIANASTRSSEDTIEDFLHHDGDTNEICEVLAVDLSAKALSEMIDGLPKHRALAINSKCTMNDDSIKYIPLIDFKSPSSDSNLELIRGFLNKSRLRGLLLESGQSYHFYGIDVIEPDQWITFMGNCLLAPYSDSRWIGHALIARTSTLRITAQPPLKEIVPYMCEKLL